jgi:hypothetical protein
MRTLAITNNRYPASVKVAALELAVKLGQLGIKDDHLTAYLFEIVRLARRYRRIQTNRCNFPISDRMETEEANIEEKIRSFADHLRLTVTFTGDPRGYCVWLHHKKLLHNTLGGPDAGYGVGEEPL